jgi:hypothetical protein
MIVVLMRSDRLLVALLFAGCSSGSTLGVPENSGPKDAGLGGDSSLCSVDCPSNVDGSAMPATDGAPPTDTDAGPCTLDSASDLPGVHIVFTTQTCTFTLAQAAAGIAIEYDVVVDADVTGVIPEGQNSAPAAGPSGLIVFEKLAGAGQNYCLCDVGLGAMTSPNPVTIKMGTYHSTFSWMGKNWNGPSDTGNPMGTPFPVGDYRLDVSAIGSVVDADAGSADAGSKSFKVDAGFRITLVP